MSELRSEPVHSIALHQGEMRQKTTFAKMLRQQNHITNIAIKPSDKVLGKTWIKLRLKMVYIFAKNHNKSI